jgi:rhodanese-related sulfurtransferase
MAPKGGESYSPEVMSGTPDDSTTGVNDLTALAPHSVLHLGGGGEAPQLAVGTRTAVLDVVAAATAQLHDRFDCVVVSAQALTTETGHRRAVLHTAVQHLDRCGHLAVAHLGGRPPTSQEFESLDLVPVGEVRHGEVTYSLFRRGQRFTVHDMVFEARASLHRLQPAELAAQLRASLPPSVIDSRTPSDRARFGTIEGSVHLPRTVLEWRLDPANGYLHPAVASFDQALVVVCNHGYSSSVAAANLQRLGYPNATDLIGGMQAWRAAGLPLVPPDHTFLEL